MCLLILRWQKTCKPIQTKFNGADITCTVLCCYWLAKSFVAFVSFHTWSYKGLNYVTITCLMSMGPFILLYWNKGSLTCNPALLTLRHRETREIAWPFPGSARLVTRDWDWSLRDYPYTVDKNPAVGFHIAQLRGPEEGRRTQVISSTSNDYFIFFDFDIEW